MSFLDPDGSTPLWLLAILIFCMRIGDVSIGTMRTISVVNGRLRLSVVLGFFEILLWVTAVSQVILRLREHPALIVAYAGGFAAGNAIGITIEKKLALGRSVVRVISEKGEEISWVLGRYGQVVGVFRSEMGGAPTRLVFATLARKKLVAAIAEARQVDPNLFYVAERFSETSYLTPFPGATGWRAILKKK